MSEKKTESVHQVLLSRALTKFHSELGRDDVAFADVASPEELLEQARALDSLNRSRTGTTKPIFRLEAILSHINDFAAIVALGGGAGPQVTGAVWGSLKVILLLVYQTSDTLDDVLAMLDELSLALPRFRAYEETLPLTPSLESALVDVYAEMTCFCARLIKFFRAAPHRELVYDKLDCADIADHTAGFLVVAGWKRLDGDFKQTVKRLRALSQIVDREAEVLRLKTEAKASAEVVEALESLTVKKTPEQTSFYYVPRSISKTFFGRQEVLTDIHKSFSDGDKPGVTFSLLHGLGGVGKSRLALRYIEIYRKEFDAIIWLPAENLVKMQQALTEIAQRLGLSSKQEGTIDASSAGSLIRDWLSSFDGRWLMVFDNVEDTDILDVVIPPESHGAVLVTSRDPTVGFGVSTKSFHITPFEVDQAAEALLSLVGRSSVPEAEKRAAIIIVHTLGGLPLAIEQISGFIVQQRLSLADFIPLYERNAAKIDKRSLKRGDDMHTLSTVWEVTLSSIPESSRDLQSLLAFFDPDSIHESVLLEGAPYADTDTFSFILDDMDFMDAKEPLLRDSMLHRDASNSTLSMHRLVQTAVIRRLSQDEQVKFLDAAILILSHGFENTWNKVTSHQFATWNQCELRIAHVKYLMYQSLKFGLQSNDPKSFAELVFRCAWYLYERELYSSGLDFLEFGLHVLPTSESLMYASACTLRGLIELDERLLVRALESFNEGLEIRQRLMDPNDEFIASSFNAISLVYTEMGKVAEAFDYGNRSINIRLANHSDRIGNSYSNMASTLLRMGKPDDAEEMLKRCPSLKDFSDETFLKSGNPRFAGDMILLSRIREAQSKPDEAVRMASKALTFRQKTHGNNLKTCDSQQLVASMLQTRGDYTSALSFWEQSEMVASKLPEGKGYLIRARYKLAECFNINGDERQTAVWAKAAQNAEAEYQASPIAKAGSYDCWIPWMLW